MPEPDAEKTDPGLHVAGFSRQGLTEMFLAAPALGGKPLTDLFRRLRRCLRERPGAEVVRETVFGMARAPRTAPTLREEQPAWPVTQVADSSGNGEPAVGVHVHAVRGAKVMPIRTGGRVVGAVFEDVFARYGVLGDIRPDDARRPAPEQARAAFENMETALRLAGMDFSHVVRTWLYLDRILEWYDELNAVRTRFFKERGVFERLVPASTGIGAPNAAGTALVAELLAIQPKDPRVRITSAPSPLQCPAPEYGSSFSRAVEVAMPDHRRLLISGTASIEPGGRTAYPGDVEAQTDLTMRVIHAILESRGMGWSDVCRAVAYVKHAKDAPVLGRYCAAHGISPLPFVVTRADICREDLLFEVEVDALRVTNA